MGVTAEQWGHLADAAFAERRAVELFPTGLLIRQGEWDPGELPVLVTAPVELWLVAFGEPSISSVTGSIRTDAAWPGKYWGGVARYMSDLKKPHARMFDSFEEAADAAIALLEAER